MAVFMDRAMHKRKVGISRSARVVARTRKLKANNRFACHLPNAPRLQAPIALPNSHSHGSLRKQRRMNRRTERPLPLAT